MNWQKSAEHPKVKRKLCCRGKTGKTGKTGKGDEKLESNPVAESNPVESGGSPSKSNYGSIIDPG
jgi:hypothetical protein